FGQLLNRLKQNGFNDICGADIDEQALEVSSKFHKVYDCREIGWDNELTNSFDLIIMSHVLEHFPKDEMISRLIQIRTLLKDNGKIVIMVPNAQSNTGAYWAYEDFTHHYLFTSGSIYYVLKAAGFSKIDFIDVDCTAGLKPTKRVVKRILLSLYKINFNFWNRITTSYFHRPSPQVFSYEIKICAKK
ncbi:MAG: class I SAM-dependent methyltransferase, partial [Sphaerospermopsis kisseleviana]